MIYMRVIGKEMLIDVIRHKNDDPEEKKEDKKTEKPKTSKQKWTAWLEANTHPTPLPNLEKEPSDSINQTDCKSRYNLAPADMVVLKYFPKPNPKYGNTTKLFDEDEVKELCWRKTAILAGVEQIGKDEAELLEKGKTLFDEEKS
jgi:hypothetical protein